MLIKSKKGLAAIVLSFVMAMAMAVPAFASSFDNGANQYHIRNESLSNSYLNLEGNGGVYNGRDVTVYNRLDSSDQSWLITNTGNGSKVYNAQVDVTGNRYALNINNGNSNCNIYRDSGSNNVDSVVDAAGNMGNFTIRLAQHSGLYYLYAYTDGSRQVKWGSTVQSWNELA